LRISAPSLGDRALIHLTNYVRKRSKATAGGGEKRL
jgi:hypothetical protein